MNITINPQETQQAISYPVIMQAQDTKQIVLFTGRETGTRLHSGNFSALAAPTGEYIDNWLPADDGRWKPFKGTITLSND